LNNYYQTIQSPIGALTIEASDLGLRSIHYNKEINGEFPNGHTEHAVKELRCYFNQNLLSFTVPLDWTGYSDFFIQVWQYLKTIPYGKTVTYMSIAKYLNNPGAVRAVGMANGKNPIPIIVPCHRVIGSNGDLTGFALGIDIKEKLLALENPQQFGIQGNLF